MDLHDHDRTPGSSIFSPREERTGDVDGLWLSIGAELLEYLYDKDMESNEAWINTKEIIEILCRRYRVYGIEEVDVQTVLNHLSTPTKLNFVTDDTSQSNLKSLSTKSHSQLIEYPKNIKAKTRCRITNTGIRAVQMAQVAENWLYAKGNADKVTTAIKLLAFNDIPELVDSLISQVRTFSKQLTSVLEKRHKQEIVEEFNRHQNDYLEVIREVQVSVEDAIKLFSTTEIKDRFSEWLDSAPEYFSEYTIDNCFKDLLQAIERLNRKFQSCIIELTSEERDYFGAIDFDKAAVGLAFEPISHQMIELMMRSLGPYSYQFCAPLMSDFDGLFKAQVEEQKKRTLEFTNQTGSNLPSAIEKFLEKYKEAIKSELENGPVSLSTAIERGWITVDGENMLSQLVGIYTAPDWLTEHGEMIEVSIEKNSLHAAVTEDGYLVGDNLIMSLVSNDHENERQ